MHYVDAHNMATRYYNKSQLPQMNPSNMLRHAHCVVHKRGRSVW